jgi:hypothetical protein
MAAAIGRYFGRDGEFFHFLPADLKEIQVLGRKVVKTPAER